VPPTTNFTFSGSPDAIEAAWRSHQATMQGHAAEQQANAQRDAARYQAQGNILSSLYQQPAQFANAMAGAYGNYNSGLSNMATAMANERGAMYGANAMAEAARMGALGNLGSASLGAYGSAANASMDAWARNQQSYNQALATAAAADQAGLAGLGSSRYAALSGLGNAYAGLGRAEIAGGALSGAFGGGYMPPGGGFSAEGTTGPIASGGYTGMPMGNPGGGISYTPGSTTAMGRLEGLQDAIMSPDYRDALLNNSALTRQQLDRQHYSSRDMPSSQLSTVYDGLQGLLRDGTDPIMAGMDQFYGNQRSAGSQFMGGMGDLRGQMQSGYDSFGQNLSDFWNQSLGKVGLFARR
jgi:hypothetical protein